MNPIDDRQQLRQRMRQARARLSASERIAAAASLASTLEQLPEFVVDQHVAGYWATGGELPLLAAHAQLIARDQGYYLPVLAASRRLRFAPAQRGQAMHANRFGIPEPECAQDDLISPADLDLVLLPLLGFDRRGHRLGSGGGYYDRSFAFLRKLPRPGAPLLVGIGYSFQELPALAPQAWDVTLDFVATERELIDCGAPPGQGVG